MYDGLWAGVARMWSNASVPRYTSAPALSEFYTSSCEAALMLTSEVTQNSSSPSLDVAVILKPYVACTEFTGLPNE